MTLKNFNPKKRFGTWSLVLFSLLFMVPAITNWFPIDMGQTSHTWAIQASEEQGLFTRRFEFLGIGNEVGNPEAEVAKHEPQTEKRKNQ